LTCLLLQILLFLSLSKRFHGNSFMSAGEAFCLSFMTLQYFFATGHHWQLSALQFESAFIGFEKFNWLAGFVLMMLNTFSSPLLIILSIPLFIGVNHSRSASYYIDALFRYKVFSVWHILLNVIFVYLQRRHLMVWRVFAPKFLIESVLLISIDILLVFCASIIQYLSRQ